MTILNAVIIGLVQGLSEFLPVSGTGHLSIFDNLFGMDTTGTGHPLFNLLLHLGTLVAVCVAYWGEISEMFYEVIGLANLGPYAGQKQEHYPLARLFVMLVLSTLPLLLLLPIYKYVAKLFYNTIFIGIMIALSGLVIFISDRMENGKKSGKSITVLDAIIVGICQGISLIPGFSRTGVTYTAGLASGLRREFSLKYSLLLSIPAMFGASVVSLGDALKEEIVWSNMPAYLIGTVAAIISGVLAISIVKRLVKNGRFGGIAYYCWVVGVITIILTVIF